ncbi:unnamed protein product, partial [Nippostrongylus brasiliensis]|uniref:DUF1758 domain-containing protein n=1 Tax=Nippostrongylus brasiliensis TaxID=27835 RepID=A0A0N4XIZ9_NIPBR
MFKYNYLLKALRGEAREAVGKFQVTKDNYERAIQFLQAKYDNKEVLINNLIERLESCSLRGSTIKDQRSLLERIQVITTQLAENGEQVNSTWIIKKVLTKFPTSIRRKVIMRKQGTPSSSLTMAKVLQYLDEVLSNEEMCLLYTEKGAPDFARKEKSSTNAQFSRKPPIDSSRGAKPYSCMFCKGGHSPFECTKYTTPQDRAQYLRSNQLCLICASTLHKTLECKRRLCFKCNGAHHTSCCFKQQVNSTSSISQQKSDRETPAEPEKLTLSKKQAEKTQKKVNKPTPMVHTSQVLDDDTSKEFEGGNSSEEKAILQLQAVLNMQSNEKSFLPTGEITIQDPTTRKLRKIEVLLDSGAEVSFIDSSLASQLNLPIIREKSMTLHTFGASTPREAACKLVKLEGWDSEGTPCTMELFTHDVLTRAFSPPLIPEIDQDVIRSLNLTICNKANKKIIKPSILLGPTTMSDASEARKDFQYLANIHKGLSPDKLERDMKRTLKEIHQYIKVSTTLDVNWTHHLYNTTCVPIGDGEMALIVNRFLRTASETKEKLQGLMQRYALFDSMYMSLGKCDEINQRRRTDWCQEDDVKVDHLIAIVVKEIAVLERNIRNIEHELGKAEKRINDNGQRGNILVDNPFDRKLQEMKGRIAELEFELEAAKRNAAKRAVSSTDDGLSCKVQVLSDDDYMAQLIEETSGPNEEIADEDLSTDTQTKDGDKMGINDNNDRGEKNENNSDKESNIQEDLHEMEMCLYRLPKRKIGRVVFGKLPRHPCTFCNQKGVHFSDSCPIMTHGDERFQYVKKKGICQYCILPGCPEVNCPQRNTEC